MLERNPTDKAAQTHLSVNPKRMDEQPEFNFEAKSKILYKCKVFAFYACVKWGLYSHSPSQHPQSFSK